MADFLTSYKITSQIEGGYANDAADRGGETYKGISRNNFPGWTGWKLIDHYKSLPHFPANLETDEALEQLIHSFYKINFWDVNRLDEINDQQLANEMYDTGVNCGTGIAALILQQSLNVNNNNGHDYQDIAEDRAIGPTTIRLTNEHKRPKELFKTMNILQGARYVEICRKNPGQERFWRSWLSRVSF